MTRQLATLGLLAAMALSSGCAMMADQYYTKEQLDQRIAEIREGPDHANYEARIRTLTTQVYFLAEQVIRLSERSDQHTKILFVVAPLSVAATVISVGTWFETQAIIRGLQAGH